MKEVLYFLVVLLQIYIGVIASISKLKKDGNQQFPLNLTFAGGSLMVACVLCIGLSMALHFMDEDDQTAFQTQLQINDSTSQKKYADKLESNNKSVVKLLAEYGLQVDSSNKKIIQSLRDSVKNNVTNNYGPSPNLGMSIPDMITLDSVGLGFKKFQLNFAAYESSCFDINIQVAVIINSGGNYKIIVPFTTFLSHANIAVNKVLESKVNITSFYEPTTFFIFYMKGTYKDRMGKTFNFDEIKSYDLKKNSSGDLSYPFSEEVRNLFKN